MVFTFFVSFTCPKVKTTHVFLKTNCTRKLCGITPSSFPIFGFFEHNTNNRHEVESPMRWLPKFRVCWNSRRCAYRELFWKDLYEIFLTYQCVMVEHYWNKQSSIHAWVRGDWFFSTKGHWFSVWKPLYTVMNICPNWIVAWMSIPTHSAWYIWSKILERFL